jgi:multidrug efflux system membrane fusion protein
MTDGRASRRWIRMKRSTRMAAVFGVLVVAAGVAWYLNAQRRTPPPVADGTSQAVRTAETTPGGAREPRGRPAEGASATDGRPSQAGGKRRGDGAPVPVVTVVLEPRTVPILLRVVGRAEAFSTVSLRSRIDGQILSVNFRPGESVRRGQAMVVLDDRVPKAQAAQARANLARDQANLEKAVADLRRSEDLVSKGFVSSAQVDAARAAMSSLQATVAADRAAIELATTQLSYTQVTAPIDGVAGNVLAFPGSIVKANDTPLVVINQIRPINVAFSIPEGRLPEIRAVDGNGARELPVTARVPGDDREPLDGRLTFVDNAVDPTTGTIVLKAEFANESRRLTPGQFVEVDIRLREVREAIVIPSEALQNGPQGAFVYVARSDGTVELRPVQTSAGEGPTLIVTRGLKAGERVVVDGQLRLTPGARYTEVGAGATNGRRPADPS